MPQNSINKLPHKLILAIKREAMKAKKSLAYALVRDFLKKVHCKQI